MGAHFVEVFGGLMWAKRFMIRRPLQLKSQVLLLMRLLILSIYSMQDPAPGNLLIAENVMRSFQTLSQS